VEERLFRAALVWFRDERPSGLSFQTSDRAFVETATLS
jgi:hypothetical protein